MTDFTPRRVPVLVSTILLGAATFLLVWFGQSPVWIVVAASATVAPIIWLTMFEGMRLHSWSSLVPCLLVTASMVLMPPAETRLWIAAAAAIACLVSGSAYMLANRREDKQDLDRHVR